jgi:Abnormal spindle-like microcephaly-assoc'd, ASPM-SPD-2-Hydin/Protein of unknown function (DUF1573)
LTRSARFLAVLACLGLALCATDSAQMLNTFTGLSTSVKGMNPTAAPDVTIAVGTIEYCEHVNSAYQCWYKSGANANQPVKFLGSTNPKSDSGPWSQNSDNNGNTPNCPTAYTPNSQLIHDNVYNLWILEKRITSALNGDNYMCVAISNVEDVSSTSPAFAWFAFEYNLDNVIPTNSQGNYYYPDYPQSGLWQSSTSTTPPYTAATDQAMWITYDLLNPNASDNIVDVLLCAVDLAGLRASTSSPYQNNSHTPACVLAESMTTFNQSRSWVPANNSDTTPPIDADGEMFTYMIEPPKNNTSYLTSPTATQGVQQWTINWSAAAPTPTFVNSWDLPSTQPNGDQLGCFNPKDYYDTVCVPQPSTATTGIYIDSVADRMQQFFHYTSNGGTGSVWTSAHAIQIVPSATSNTQTEADIRILQRQSASPNAVYVAGDYPTLDPVDPNAWVVLPSVARDKVGNLQGILGISGPGSNEHPGLDTWTFVPGTLTNGTWGYVANPNTDGDAEDTDSLNYRWGDWYSAVLDPSDSCTVWVAGEYLPQNRTSEPYWYTEIGQLPPMSSCTGGTVTLSATSLNFGSQAVGVQSAPQVVTLTNGLSTSLTISNIAAAGDYTQTNTCQQPVAAGGTCTVSVYFTPATSGTLTGTLTITDNASNSPQTVTLTGVGAGTAITLTPSTLAFGNQVLTTTGTAQTITVSNSGAGNVVVNSVAASGSYSETTTCTGVTLTPSQTCSITVTFTPSVTGSIPGAITVNDTATGAPHFASLTGTGLLGVTLSTNLTFVPTNVGSTSAAQTMTVSNNQNHTLTFNYAVSSDFSAAGNGASPCNGTLAANSKCTFGVTFAPSINGTIKGTLTITPTSAGNVAVGGFTGTGQDGSTAPLTFSPASLSFGNVGLGTSSSKQVTVKNTGSSALTINSITAEGYFTAAPSGTTPCSGTLNAGKQCTFTATFSPVVTGTTVSGVTISDTASVGTQIQNATGVGVLDVTLSPASINFGTVTVGSTSSVQVVTVSNNLTTSVPLTSVVASGDFISTAGGSPQCGSSLLANSSCTLGVQFAPGVTGSISGALTVSYSSGSSPQVVSLSGTGSQ